MFKMRLHTCRIVLLTSLVWFLAVIVILSLYSDCLSGNCGKKPGEFDVMVPVAEELVEDSHKRNNRDDFENQVDTGEHGR